MASEFSPACYTHFAPPYARRSGLLLDGSAPRGRPRAPHRRMAEVRARAARHKGQLNFESELRQALFAFGDEDPSLPETVRVLDEIVTDFVIETCHTAARSATYSNRQKIKVDDFKFAIRRSEPMLGRVQDMAARQADVMKARKEYMEAETAEGRVGLERGVGKYSKDDEGREGERPRKRRKKKSDGVVVMES